MPVETRVAGSASGNSRRTITNKANTSRGPTTVTNTGTKTNAPVAPSNNNVASAVRTPQAPLTSAWANGSKSITRSIINPAISRVQGTMTGSQYPQQVRNTNALTAARGAPSMSGLPAQMAQLGLGGPINAGPNVYNPSMGPSASAVAMPVAWRGNPGSQATNQSNRMPMANGVCKLSCYTRRHFHKGDVIALPYHCANSNPHVDPATDNRWRMTCEGPVYSKRRMMVVLYIHQQDMFALPLYTHSGSGLTKKPAYLKNEYVSMKNVGDEGFLKLSDHAPVEVQCRRRPMDKETVIQLTGGVKVGCNEDISPVGRITERGHVHLMALWEEITARARDEKDKW